MTTTKHSTRSSKWPYISHFEDALLTIKKRNRIEAANARILRNYRDALNVRAIIEAAKYVERITKMAQFKLNIIVHFDEHDKLSRDGLRSNPPEYSNYHLPSEDSMTEEQKKFSEHYLLHVYLKVDELRVPTLEEAIREHELTGNAPGQRTTSSSPRSLPRRHSSYSPPSLLGRKSLYLWRNAHHRGETPPRTSAS
ncbi:hypothetical protein D6D03_08947 [Aureobasidium pullulans]|nr:hypothetical protein D6D03_08947 [Aureobasidium pullulans]